MEPLKDLVEAVEQIVELNAENARLKRQLSLVLNALELNLSCPGAVGLTETCDTTGCTGCWRKALEEVE